MRVTRLIHNAGKYLLISVYPLPTHPTHNFTQNNGGNLDTLPGWPKKLHLNRPARCAGQLRHLDPRGTKVKPVISRCCHNDNPNCPQWQPNWHYDNSPVLELVFAWYSKTVETNICYSCKAHSPNTDDRPWTDGWYLFIHHRIHDLIHVEVMKIGSFWWPTWAFTTTMSCQTNS